MHPLALLLAASLPAAAAVTRVAVPTAGTGTSLAVPAGAPMIGAGSSLAGSPGLSTAEAGLRVAEFFAAPWPNVERLRPALARLQEPLVAKLYHDAVRRLLTKEAYFDKTHDLKLAVLTPELVARLDPDLRRAVIAEQEKRGTEKLARIRAEIGAVAADWDDRGAKELSLGSALPAGAIPDTALAVLSPAPERSGPTTGVRLFAALPAPARAALARRGETARGLQTRALLAELGQLLPPGSLVVMAGLTQTSHDYLVHWLPAAPEAAQAAAREVARHPDWPTYRVSGARGSADKQAWFERLADAKAKLEELASLQKDSPEGERAAVQLALGLVHAYSYGFASGLEHRHHDRGHDSLGGGNREFVELATAQLTSALNSFESLGWGDAALLTRFLIGKHAVNGRHAWSNPGIYDRSWRALGAEPRAYEYEALAREMLTSVVDAVRARAEVGSLPIDLYFRSRAALNKLMSGLEPAGKPFSFSEFRESGGKGAATAELLTDYLLTTPRERVEASLRDDPRPLASELLNDLRWTLQVSGDTRLRDAMFDERRAGPMTYGRLLDMLVDDAGLERLRPLREREIRPALR